MERPVKARATAADSTRSNITARFRWCRCRRKRELAKFTQTALADLRYPLLAQAKLPPRGQTSPPRPVPERVGEPSVFQHVIYIIKENRTYDQVLGDMTRRQRRRGLVHLRRARHAQPAQARPRFRAAGQHLLLRHPERRRPSMDRQRHGDRLHGALVRRLAAQLSRRQRRRMTRTRWRIRRRVSSGTTRSRTAKPLRDFGEFTTGHIALERSRAQRQADVSRLLPRFHQRLERNRLFLPSRTSSRCGLIMVTNTSAGIWTCRTSCAPRNSSRT